MVESSDRVGESVDGSGSNDRNDRGSARRVLANEPVTTSLVSTSYVLSRSCYSRLHNRCRKDRCTCRCHRSAA